MTTAAPNWSTNQADRLASYRDFVLRKIRAAEARGHEVSTAALTTGRELERSIGVEPRLAEVLLGQLRVAGVVAYSSGRWWIRPEADR